MKRRIEVRMEVMSVLSDAEHLVNNPSEVMKRIKFAKLLIHTYDNLDELVSVEDLDNLYKSMNE